MNENPTFESEKRARELSREILWENTWLPEFDPAKLGGEDLERTEQTIKAIESDPEFMASLEDDARKEDLQRFPIKLQRIERVPEKQYGIAVEAEINKLLLDKDEMAVIMLAPFLHHFSDDGSQVFVFDNTAKEEAKRIIKEWADAMIKGPRALLPPMTMQYFVAILKEQQFDWLLEDPNLTDSRNLKTAIEKAKAGFKAQEAGTV